MSAIANSRKGYTCTTGSSRECNRVTESKKREETAKATDRQAKCEKWCRYFLLVCETKGVTQ